MSFPTSVSFPSATFSATSSFPGILEITNVQKLSLSVNTLIGTRVKVTDGFVVSGLAGDGALDNGLFVASGTENGRTEYLKVDSPSLRRITWNGIDRWQITDDGAVGGSASEAPSDVAQPWLGTWTDVGYGVPTVASIPTVQELTSPSITQGGVFVSGGTQNGIYAKTGTGGGKNLYNLLGQSEDYDVLAVHWNGGVRWQITDDSSTPVYYSLSDVATPDLASNWKNASDDSSASITVTNVTQGELDAGIFITNAGTSNANDVYLVIGNNTGKNVYVGIVHTLTLQWTGLAWKVNNTNPQSAIDTKIPSDASFNDSAIVTRDNVASEANWEVV